VIPAVSLATEALRRVTSRLPGLGAGLRRAGGSVWRWKWRIVAGAGLLVLTTLTTLGVWAWRVVERIDLRSLAAPSLVYAMGPSLRPGLSTTAADLAGTLGRLGYAEVNSQPERPGQFRRETGAWEIFLHARDDPQGRRPAQRVRLALEADRIGEIMNSIDGTRLDSIELEPELLGDLGEMANRVRRPARLATVPAHLVAAVLAAEDRRFFEHMGLDVRAALRAFWANLRHGKVVQGGSTVTQQLVKTLGLSSQRSWDAKLRKQALAVVLEWRFAKTEILEAYLNTIYLGRDGPVALYGVDAASRRYFGKGVEDVDLGEAATLAGMIRAPNEHSPIRHPDRARQGRDAVLLRMRDLRVIDQAAFVHATEKEVRASPNVSRRLLGPHFFDYVYSQLERAQERQGVRPGGLRVYTSLDPVLQRTAETVLVGSLELLEARFRHLRRSNADERVQGALIALDPVTGEIRALVGGRDYALSQFNRATHAHRPPGSTFKPFVFLAALRVGAHGEPPRLTAASVLDNQGVTVQVGDESWTSRKVGRSFLDRATVGRTLELSLNAPTVQAAETVGFDAVIQMARDVGFTSPIARIPTLALGGSEVTPLELVAAYAPLANAGRRVDVGAIRAIADSDGRVSRPPRPRNGPAVSAEAAFLVTHLLTGVIERGTGAMARALGVEGTVAGKTGSTKRDAWFVGYTPRLVTVVWVGFDGPDELRLSGAWAALPIWANFMRTAMAVVPGGTFSVPPSVVFRDVDATNGKLATPFCPIVFSEAFLSSAVPTEVCLEHGPTLSGVPGWPSGYETR
jgi:penicillin-binding protein 1B